MTVNVGGKEVKRGEKEVDEEKKEEVKFNPADYWCDVILEKTTPEKAEDRSLPTDAFNVTYVVEGETRLDVTRSEKMANVCDKNDWIKDEFYFIVHWRRYAIYKKEVYGDGEEEWCLEDMGESSPDRYCYKNGKIEGHWDTPMEEEE